MGLPERIHGWKPDAPDVRDYKFRLAMGPVEPPPTWLEGLFPCLRRKPTVLPEFVDLTSKGWWPEVFDQGALGSCTAQATVAMVAHVLAKEGEETADRVLSRLLLYGESRGWVQEDTGATLRDTMKALARVGDCPEDFWKYNLPSWALKPGPAVYEAAAKRRGVVYARLDSLRDMQQCLADGYPFVLGFMVYESFESVWAGQPVAPMPKKTEELLGGHAVCAVGYDSRRKVLKIRNSWGRAWGDGGHFYMPFEMATNRDLVDDLWTLRTIATVPGPG